MDASQMIREWAKMINLLFDQRENCCEVAGVMIPAEAIICRVQGWGCLYDTVLMDLELKHPEAVKMVRKALAEAEASVPNSNEHFRSLSRLIKCLWQLDVMHTYEAVTSELKNKTEAMT